MINYDIIPDIHGDNARLQHTLLALGYNLTGDIWRHPQGRKAAFLGDFIDGGTDNRLVIEQVRAMLNHDTAVAIMGNHELNALLYHSEGKNSDAIADGFMRSHSPKNFKQHQSFLWEYPLENHNLDSGLLTKDVLDWFLSLPLFLELDGLRLVHACWDQVSIDRVLEKRPDAKLTREDLQEIALENQPSPLCRAVITLLKGPEVALPLGYSFLDKGNNKRFEVRVKWWASSGSQWADAVLSVANPDSLPKGPFPTDFDIQFYETDAPPVFFGHYKRDGKPIKIDAHNVMCLDYPHTPCAYRWNGEAKLDASSLVIVDYMQEQ
jgi:hypothetical protein